jgi:hypothetical protein
MRKPAVMYHMNCAVLCHGFGQSFAVQSLDIKVYIPRLEALEHVGVERTEPWTSNAQPRLWHMKYNIRHASPAQLTRS